MRKRSTYSVHRADSSDDEDLIQSDGEGISGDEQSNGVDGTSSVDQGGDVEVTHEDTEVIREDIEVTGVTKNTEVTQEDNSREGEDMVEDLWEQVDNAPFNKGDQSKLIVFVEEHLCIGRKCISVEILTDIFGLDGKNRRDRFYGKGIKKQIW